MSFHDPATKKLFFFLCCSFALLILLSCFGLPSSAVAVNAQGLVAEDCGKCHAFQQKMLNASGGKHATEIGCLDCHPQHPPTEQATRLACSSCHIEQPHFQLDGCLHCHTDPHRPLAMLRDPLKPARKECLSCHEQVAMQMATEPSRHAELFCNRCHSKHKQVPGCLDCHSPHQAAQKEALCHNCHPAHQPLQIVPQGYLSASTCRACHVRQANDLATTTTLHGGINCLYCHKGQHPDVPRCQDCHGLPHTQAIHVRYLDCLECHGNAHNLINK